MIDKADKEIYKEVGKKQFINHENNTIEIRSQEIGIILKFLRKRTGLTQQTIANNIGIAQQTYAGYESGKHEPSIEIAIRLANFYNISMDYITGRFIGSDTSKEILQEIEVEKILEESAVYFESLEANTKNYMNMLKKNSKK